MGDRDAAARACPTVIGRNPVVVNEAVQGRRSTGKSRLYQAFLLNHDSGEIFALLSPNGENAIPVSPRLLLR
jgi:hypothetical protein